MRPTQEQQDIIEMQNANICVVATAGSGKTSMLVEKLTTVPRDISVLVLTFANEAADELTKRFVARKTGHTNVTIATVHATCSRFLQSIAFPKRLDNGLAYGIFIGLCSGKSKEEIYRIQSAIDVAVNTMAPQGKHQELYDKYTARKQQLGIMDFNDLMIETLALAEQLPKYDLVIVDEVQDITEVQYAIIRALTGGTWIYVGDDDQAIFDWRGASSKIMLGLQFEEGVYIKSLSTNFRCPEEIMVHARKLIELAPDRYKKQIQTVKTGGVVVAGMQRFEDLLSNINKDRKSFVLVRTAKEFAVVADLLIRAGLPVRLTFPSSGGLLGDFNSIEQLRKVYAACIQSTDVAKFKYLAAILRHEGNFITVASKMRRSGDSFFGIWNLPNIASLRKVVEANDGKGFIDFFLAHVSHDIILEYLSSLDLPLDELISYIELASSRAMEMNNETANINLMTTHACKGKEAEVVHLCFVNAGNYDLGKPEDVRLLYVGMTRALKELFMYPFGEPVV